MSTQQQINQYTAVIAQKQEQRADQERTLGGQQIQLAQDEKFLNDLARISLDLTRPDLAQLAAEEILVQKQRVSDAKIAIAQTQDNIASLDGSIRYNTTQLDLFVGSLPAQGVPAGTAADQSLNAATNAAQIAPAPLPAASAPGAVENIGAGRFGLDAPEQRAEIITPALLPPSLVDGFAIPTPGTGIIREPGVIPNLERPNFGIDIPSFGVVLLPAPPDAIERGDQELLSQLRAPAPVSPAADPYSGLTPAQIEFLGNADPTDPFIRARGGLPPLIQPVNVTAPAPVAGAPGLLDPQQRAQIITPAPVAGAPGLLDPQQQAAARIAAPEPVRDFVIDPNTGEFVATDSAQAEEIRAEQNRVQTDAPAPVTVAGGDTGEVPGVTTRSPGPVRESDEGGDAEAQEALAIRNAAAEPVAGSTDPGLADPQQRAALAVQNPDPADDPYEAARLAGEDAEGPPAVFEAEDLEDSPYEVARLAGEEEGDGPTLEAPDPADDPYEAARLAAEEGESPPTFEAEDLEDSPYEVARLAGEEEGDGPTLEAPEPVNDFVIDPVTGEQVPSDSDRAAEIRAEEAAQEQVQVNAPEPVPDTKYDEFGNVVPNTPEAIAAAEAKAAEQRAAEEQAAAKLAAINQATLQSVYKAVGSSDWRVRLQLAPSSNYLYNVKAEEGGPGILAPLYNTNGVIFPYTPAINTSYKANYEQYDLVHSNYRGVYYKNSRVDDLQIRGIFTAQDTNEANYLLAVIHFFRSVTKMFYGKDDQRGSPPPLVFLSGFGMNQFYGHPCVVTSFAYNLPDNVDYIRATSVNNYGTDLLSRRTASSPSSAAGLGATANRLLNAGLANFTATPPAPSSVVASINNTQLANYVPTKMDIDITLIPVQTRSQVSKQFSLKGFANGELIKGGFW